MGFLMTNGPGLMVTAAARPMLRWAARTLSPCDGAIARLPPLSCGLRGR